MTVSAKAGNDQIPSRVSRFGALVIAGAYGWGHGRTMNLPPRPLVQVGLRPLITYGLEWLWTGGARQATIAVHGRSAEVARQLGSVFGSLPLAYCHDPQPRGAAGCMKDAASGLDDDTIVVIEGAIIPTFSLPRLLAAHRKSNAAMTVVTAPGTRGGPMRMAGVYVVDRRALAYVPDTGFQDIKETLIPRLHRAGEAVRVHASTDVCRRVVDLASYLSVNYWVIDRTARAAPPPGRRAIRSPQGSMVAHETATIAPSAMTIGPVIVGAGARIDEGAIVIGPTAIGDGATISPGAIVTRTIVGREALVGVGSAVHAAVLGERARVEAGTQVLNAVHVAASDKPTWLDRMRQRWGRITADQARGTRPVTGVPAEADVAGVAVTADAGAPLQM